MNMNFGNPSSISFAQVMFHLFIHIFLAQSMIPRIDEPRQVDDLAVQVVGRGIVAKEGGLGAEAVDLHVLEEGEEGMPVQW